MAAADEPRATHDGIGPPPVRFNWKEFLVLLMVLGGMAAWALLGPAFESELVANCARRTGENYAADPRKVYDGLATNLAAAGFAHAGPAADAPAGWESAVFRGEGVVVTVKYRPGEHCPRHRTAERTMDWEVAGPGWRVSRMQRRVRAWVGASKTG
jgi:hypothetical protein